MSTSEEESTTKAGLDVDDSNAVLGKDKNYKQEAGQNKILDNLKFHAGATSFSDSTLISQSQADITLNTEDEEPTKSKEDTPDDKATNKTAERTTKQERNKHERKEQIEWIQRLSDDAIKYTDDKTGIHSVGGVLLCDIFKDSLIKYARNVLQVSLTRSVTNTKRSLIEFLVQYNKSADFRNSLKTNAPITVQNAKSGS